MWDLEALLEEKLRESFCANWKEILEEARLKVRDKIE